MSETFETVFALVAIVRTKFNYTPGLAPKAFLWSDDLVFCYFQDRRILLVPWVFTVIATSTMDLGHTFYLLLFEKVRESMKVIIFLSLALDLVSAATPQFDYSPGGSFFNLTQNKISVASSRDGRQFSFAQPQAQSDDLI
jgi:hypothetical protein